MQSIKSLQSSFKQSILEKDSENLNFISSNHAKERLDIYRQTIFENMRNALEITFSGVWSLIGKECADNATYLFLKHQKNLPTSGCIDNWGQEFSNFLGSAKELQHLIYLKEFASYEWLKHLSYGAKEAKYIEVSEISSIPQEKIDTAKFIFLPSVFTFSSKYKINEIEEIIDNPNAPPIKSINNESYAIIARPNNIIFTYWIKNDLFLFLEDLINGSNLTEASKKISQLYPEFDLTNAISFILQKQIIAKVIT